MNNSPSDKFHAATTEGRDIQMMAVSQLKKLGSGDYPGKKVGQVLGAKRSGAGHAGHVAKVREWGVTEPVTIKAGVLIDGHHRVAAAEDAGVKVPVRRTP